MQVVNYEPKYPECRVPASFPTKQNINNGITNGYYGMPQKFRGADGANTFSSGREVYARAIHKENNLIALQNEYKKKNIPGKPVGVQDSTLHIQRKKNIAIGKGSIPGNNTTETSSTLSFKAQYNSNRNTVNSALRRTRNLGYVPPPKTNYNVCGRNTSYNTPKKLTDNPGNRIDNPPTAQYLISGN